MTKHFPSTQQALGSIPSTVQEGRQEGGRKGGQDRRGGEGKERKKSKGEGKSKGEREKKSSKSASEGQENQYSI